MRCSPSCDVFWNEGGGATADAHPDRRGSAASISTGARPGSTSRDAREGVRWTHHGAWPSGGRAKWSASPAARASQRGDLASTGARSAELKVQRRHLAPRRAASGAAEAADPTTVTLRVIQPVYTPIRASTAREGGAAVSTARRVGVPIRLKGGVGPSRSRRRTSGPSAPNSFAPNTTVGNPSSSSRSGDPLRPGF